MHLLMSSSVTRFGEIPHFGQYLKIFGNILKVYLVLGKVFSSLSYNLYAFGQIFNAENGQILKTQSGRLVTLMSSYTLPKTSGNETRRGCKCFQKCFEECKTTNICVFKSVTNIIGKALRDLNS